MCLRIRKDFFKAGLVINVPKCQLDPAMCLRKVRFEVDMGEGRFRVPTDRWKALQSLVDSILSARGWRVQARKLASLAWTVISMKLAWGPVIQLYSMHIYMLVNSVFSLNYWKSLSEEARKSFSFGSNCHACGSRRRSGLAYKKEKRKKEIPYKKGTLRTSGPQWVRQSYP